MHVDLIRLFNVSVETAVTGDKTSATGRQLRMHVVVAVVAVMALLIYAREKECKGARRKQSHSKRYLFLASITALCTNSSIQLFQCNQIIILFHRVMPTTLSGWKKELDCYELKQVGVWERSRAELAKHAKTQHDRSLFGRHLTCSLPRSKISLL